MHIVPVTYGLEPAPAIVTGRHRRTGNLTNDSGEQLYPNLFLKELAQIVCAYCEVDGQEMTEYHKKSRQQIAQARQLFCYLWGIEQLVGYRAVVAFFQFKNHTAIVKCRSKVVLRMRTDYVYKSDVKKLEENVSALCAEWRQHYFDRNDNL